jgi:hypothetical protein
VTRIGLPKRASYNPANAGVNIAPKTLTCFSARLGLLPLVGQNGFITEAQQRRSCIIEHCALVQAAHVGLI